MNFSPDFLPEDSQHTLQEPHTAAPDADFAAAEEAEENAIARRFNAMRMTAKVALYNDSLLAILGAMLFCTAASLFMGSWSWIATSLAILVGMLGFGWVALAKRGMARDLVDPITTISGEMSRLSSGARDIEISGQSRQDEIGDLARSLDAFQTAYTRLDQLAIERDIADQLRVENEENQRQEFLKLAEQFEAMVGEVTNNVATAASQLNSRAQDLAGSAHLSSEKAKMVVDAMAQASSGVAAAAAASDEFALSIDEISRQASRSEELARNASRAAEGTDKTISALSNEAEQVTQVVELIQSIANRTNLLALNASIEAARGGEAGRGFAVVASEVKELANQTSTATSEVSVQIETMQGSTNAGVSELQAIAERVRELETTSTSIAAAVDQQSVAGKDLAHSIDLSARGTEDVNVHTAEMLEQASKVGTVADELLGSATDLEGQAKRLSDQAKSFLERIRKD